MIVHFARKQEWQAAQEEGKYTPADFETGDFIHCSSPSQAEAVANEHFAGQDDVVLLWIDPARVGAGVVYERPDGQEVGDLYPHIYGALNTDAVVGAAELDPFDEGTFVLPKQPAA